ncbi:hypothetical protein GOP47_0023403 [Adiantum capillus-veneris]|uniref:Uncharacterized protein n=1 Tax=Adiantum capillus-veneris TaxID=13818 RepID=A0A9D4U3L7_ADICA|nr:hypothetical protein GOP47_0023403 [Adiantum capillus-veneris]
MASKDFFHTQEGWAPYFWAPIPLVGARPHVQACKGPIGHAKEPWLRRDMRFKVRSRQKEKLALNFLHTSCVENLQATSRNLSMSGLKAESKACMKSSAREARRLVCHDARFLTSTWIGNHMQGITSGGRRLFLKGIRSTPRFKQYQVWYRFGHKTREFMDPTGEIQHHARQGRGLASWRGFKVHLLTLQYALAWMITAIIHRAKQVRAA